MRFPDPDQVRMLQQRWTDRYVRIKPGHEEYRRFEGRVGRVITVNFAGRALVDFADGAWYDIPASTNYLEEVSAEEAKGHYDPTVNSAQPFPARQG